VLCCDCAVVICGGLAQANWGMQVQRGTAMLPQHICIMWQSAGSVNRCDGGCCCQSQQAYHQEAGQLHPPGVAGGCSQATPAPGLG
jgi:hypothetical protein